MYLLDRSSTIVSQQGHKFMYKVQSILARPIIADVEHHNLYLHERLNAARLEMGLTASTDIPNEKKG